MIRFIHFFGAVLDSKAEDLGIGSSDPLPVDVYIMPDRVEAVRENIGDDGNPDGSIIYTFSRESFYVEDSPEEAMFKLGIMADKRERTIIK